MYCGVLITNGMYSSYNQFLFHSFLSALHVSNESSRSSSGGQHNTLYYTVGYKRYNCTVQYSILCRAPDDERLDSFETCRADKNLWNKKLIIRTVHLVGY